MGRPVSPDYPRDLAPGDQRFIYVGPRNAIEAGVMQIANNTYDLTRRRLIADDDPLVQRIAIGPELLGQGLINDRYRRPAFVALG